MTATLYCVLACDGCAAEFAWADLERQVPRAKEARYYAARQGWRTARQPPPFTHTGRPPQLDFCPACTSLIEQRGLGEVTL